MGAACSTNERGLADAVGERRGGIQRRDHLRHHAGIVRETPRQLRVEDIIDRRVTRRIHRAPHLAHEVDRSTHPRIRVIAGTIQRTLEQAGIAPEQVGFVSAHATSTPLGDVSELRAIRAAFGDHADRLKINAPKSMLGHTCWSAPAVETVAALGQMRRRRLHGSINVDTLDPEVDLDVCAGGSVDHDFDVFLKNAFGFGGTNCCALWRRVD